MRPLPEVATWKQKHFSSFPLDKDEQNVFCLAKHVLPDTVPLASMRTYLLQQFWVFPFIKRLDAINQMIVNTARLLPNTQTFFRRKVTTNLRSHGQLLTGVLNFANPKREKHLAKNVTVQHCLLTRLAANTVSVLFSVWNVRNYVKCAAFSSGSCSDFCWLFFLLLLERK